MSVDILDKATKLLALTTSPNIDEARNAALAFCRIVHAHGLRLTMPAPGHGSTYPSPQQRVTSSAKGKPAKRAPPEKDVEWQSMKAKYPGYCRGCPKPIKTNMPIYWASGKGAFHVACYLKST